MAPLQSKISESTRAAMRSRDRERLAVLRLINAELKQVEIDSGESLSDNDVLAVLNRMTKQRRSSADQYSQANRRDLAEQEEYEIEVIDGFKPTQMSDAEIESAVAIACDKFNATDMKNMGQIMRQLSQELAGRADMSRVSAVVRERLAPK